ncbi:MAG TPA: RsmE family RNA methyltransferase, partial [Arenimonas sp.]|nr:RsmE family RNA methyltransferase [Arenimonas sp.]
VAAIAPIFSERTEVKLDGERGGKRQSHWRGVLYSACEQCGRTRIPQLQEPATLAQYAAQERATHRLFLDPDAQGRLSQLPIAAGDHVALAIGPEGGFSERDIAALMAAGFTGIGLGPRVLRTETAGLATIAALQALFGDWR